jgi:isopentenyl diphosphate isomerase/L-lactate dehydrogenase-like FMN-dependent dehydrogenase
MINLPHNESLTEDDFNVGTLNSVDEFVHQSKKILTDGAFQWVDGGSESGQTAKLNSTFAKKVGILPEILRSVSEMDLAQELFGTTVASPILAAPMGHLRVFHELGEQALFQGLNISGNIGTLSSLSRTPLSVISATQSGIPFGFQVYPYRDRDWILELIQQAYVAGARFGVVTLDSPVRTISHSKSSDFDARKFGSGETLVDTSVDLRSNFVWEDFKWLCAKSPIPLIPKGLFTESSMKKLIAVGAQGLWISNHGGRALESLIHPLHIISSSSKLKKRRVRKRASDLPVIVDGGFKYGSDVLRAISLGADFVGVGRPFLHGLVVGGAAGVSKVGSILNSELFVSMQLAGVRSIQEAGSLEKKFY